MIARRQFCDRPAAFLEEIKSLCDSLVELTHFFEHSVVVFDPLCCRIITRRFRECGRREEECAEDEEGAKQFHCVSVVC